MTNLFLTCGLPASGKTTLAKRLACDYRAVRFTADEWLSVLHPGLSSSELDTFRPGVEALQLQLAEILLKLECNVVIDWGLWARVERDKFRTSARRLGVSVVLCVCDVPVEDIRKRISERNANRGQGEFHISTADLERALHFWQPPTPDELSQFDPMPGPPDGRKE